MAKKLIQSLQEAVDFAKGNKTTVRTTKVAVAEPVKIPEHFNVQRLRKRLHLSQVEFASRFGFNLNTLRNWEHGRRQPDRAAVAYLCVISKNPEMVEHTLRH